MENELSYQIIGASIEVQKELGGPGLLENIYEEALYQELALQGLSVQRQVVVDVAYKGIKLKHPMFLDLLINDRVIVEVKATENDNPIFYNQLLTYLRLTKRKLGLIINFGEAQVKNGVQRVVNGL